MPRPVVMPAIVWVGPASAASEACLSRSDASDLLAHVNALHAELAKARLTITRANEAGR